MKDAAATKLPTRRKPSQSRSQEKVERILKATRELLVESGGSASANLTTHQIAKRAGIAVGSLYQYFPNIEAVFYEIYDGFAQQAREVLNEFDSAKYLSKPREEFFELLIQTLTAGADDEQDIIRAIRTEAKVYSALAAVEHEQADYVAKQLAGFFAYYGSKWPQDKLERLGLFVYYVDWGTWMYRDHSKAATDEAHDWEVLAFKSMIEQCFE